MVATKRAALITGGARGIGRGVVDALARRGVAIMINDLVAARAEAAAAEVRHHGGEAVATAGDVCDQDYLQEVIAQTRNRWGHLDILVNCAGVLRPTRFVDISQEEWDFVLTVNLKGTFLACQASIPGMINCQWGRIVNISSTAGKSVSTIGGAHYTAAKAGVLGLTRHLSREVARHGVTVNAICPGLIDTEMVRGTIPREEIEGYARSFPVPRLGTADEVGELVAFLASDEAAYITGASVDINGGDLTV